MPYYERVGRAGATEVHYCYHDRARPEQGAPRRKKREKPTPETQKKNNIRRAAQRLTLDLNANFGPGDWYVTLNYRKEERPPDKRTVTRQMSRFLRKLRGEYKKRNLTLKYVWVPEIGPRGGCHIHIVISGIDVRLLQEIWPHGGMYLEPLRSDRNYRKLAEYFIKYSEKTRKTFGGKQAGRYNPSKNLVHPEFKKRRRRKRTFSAPEIQVPAGWYLDKGSVQEWVTEAGYKHLYYLIVKLPEKGGPPKCRT